MPDMPTRYRILDRKGNPIHPALYWYETRRGKRYGAIAMYDGKQRWQQGFETIKEAEAWRTDEVSAMRQGRTGKAPARMTVTDFIDTRWWPDVRAGLKSRNSVATYTSHVKNVKRYLGDLRLRNLSVQDVQTFKTAMYEDELGAGAMNAAFLRLRQLLDHAVMLDMIAVNPASKVPAPAPTEHQAPILTLKQVERLLDLAEEGPHGALFSVVVFSGLRWGEVERMEWSHIDWTEQRLDIGEGKTRASRKPIWFGARTTERLRQHMTEQLAWARELGGDRPQRVFVDQNGNPLRYEDFRLNVWYPLRKRLGLPEMHFHDLRHTAASLRAKAKVHPAVAQRGLRHANVATTMNIYTDVDGDQLREAANAVEELLRG